MVELLRSLSFQSFAWFHTSHVFRVIVCSLLLFIPQVTNYSLKRSPLSYFTFLLNLTRKANPRQMQISPQKAFSLERKELTKRQELPHQTPLLLRLRQSLTNGIEDKSNAPGQKKGRWHRLCLLFKRAITAYERAAWKWLISLRYWPRTTERALFQSCRNRTCWWFKGQTIRTLVKSS